MTVFLYDTGGHWIAFRTAADDRYLYNKSGQWIGWVPWDDADAVTKQGEYLGTVVGDRLLRRQSQPYRGYPGYPGYPGYLGYPRYPGYAGYAGDRSGFSDVPGQLLVG
jgi:hypothetical protein